MILVDTGQPLLKPSMSQLQLTKPHPVGPYWDPIGLVTPVTIKYRIDLKELWSTGYGWDDILLEAIQQEWKENAKKQ